MANKIKNPKRKRPDPPEYERSRKLAALPQTDAERRALADLAVHVVYTGNPNHKRNPGNFNLTPPAAPRPGKTLCDEAGILKKEEAQRLLHEGVRKGLISEQRRGERNFPQNIWAVKGGIVVEAMLENNMNGTYHGYPALSDDPLTASIIKRWNEQ